MLTNPPRVRGVNLASHRNMSEDLRSLSTAQRRSQTHCPARTSAALRTSNARRSIESKAGAPWLGQMSQQPNRSNHPSRFRCASILIPQFPMRYATNQSGTAPHFMWLLSTDRAELHYFSDPESVPGGYAILSHVWDNEEMSFQDIQALRKQCTSRGLKRATRFLKLSLGSTTTPRDLASDKIRQSCIVAERHGYEWIWNDTCCINKESSSELSEAINSMYRYYSLAEICYAYLGDVSQVVGGLYSRVWHGSGFMESRWHTRGWTLQELIAPTFLIFLSKEWRVLGTKANLADTLEQITNIPAKVLRKEVELGSMSVAQRMSWAAGRQTTRLEDEAYCLMGIFSINMPTLYGEGRRAFHRLQEEIMKQSIDISLFAWGSRAKLPALCSSGVTRRRRVGSEHNHHKSASYLFASSPLNFKDCMEVVFSPPRSSALPSPIYGADHPSATTYHSFQLDGLPTFTITPYGVHARVPILEFRGLTIAVICCHVSAKNRAPMALLLTHCPSASDPTRPLYHTGGPLDKRMVIMDMTLPIKNAVPQWRDIYITHRPPPDAAASLDPRILINSSNYTPYRISRRSLDAFLAKGWELHSVTPPAQVPWTGSPPITFTFRRTAAQYFICVHLGRCTHPAADGEGVDVDQCDGDGDDGEEEHMVQVHWYTGYVTVPAHGHWQLLPEQRSWLAQPNYWKEESHPWRGRSWARAELHVGEPPRAAGVHQHQHQPECDGDHISEWPNRTKTFETSTGWMNHYVTLAFAECPINPASTLVVDIEYWEVAEFGLEVAGRSVPSVG
ncbi:hypothetical protein LXA43DRAFT_440791 [Ganoderma leucocontextum]|nr:hypothetical protein LXA43DRAFT_440791 [Ganoderma leucocontextum]